MSLLLLQPDWPAPAHIRAWVSCRAGGSSVGAYASLNLASHVGDNSSAVHENRRRFAEAAQLGWPIRWMQQEHGCTVVPAAVSDAASADACWSAEPNSPCAVLTADCLPVLFTDTEGSVVAAAHAGWRGLAAGVLEATVQALPAAPADLLAWLGPAIGPDAFQVGAEVRTAFIEQCLEDQQGFHPDGDRWRADLFWLAKARLQRLGVNAIFGGGLCTFSDPSRFFSHRRDGVSGRFASVITRAD